MKTKKGKKITIQKDIPDGYFYKNKYFKGQKVIPELLKDGEIKSHYFYNGEWVFKDNIYFSLKDLWEDNQDTFLITYNYLKKCYRDFDIFHFPQNCTLWSYADDENKRLYQDKLELLNEIRNETKLIEDVEDREHRYLLNITDDECAKYFKKSVNERIKILEELC